LLSAIEQVVTHWATQAVITHVTVDYRLIIHR